MFILHIEINIPLHITEDLKTSCNMDNKKMFQKVSKKEKLEGQAIGS